MSTVPAPQNNNGTAPPGPALLELRSVTAGYGRTTVLREIDITVAAGSVVALLGPNGAGKSTLLRVASGLLSPTGGEVRLLGADVTRRRAHQRARGGLCLVPEGRGIFPNLSVRENLTLQIPPWKRKAGYDIALEAFPILKERLSQSAGSLSGGQQQMLALSRCFLSEPKVVLLDEVSMGLAPRVIDQIFEALAHLVRSGVSMVLVEQYVTRALHLADHVYLLGRGQVNFSGTPSQLDEVKLMQHYIGGDEPEE
jgi:branched-chain amino acid transport system ATP-binding protein